MELIRDFQRAWVCMTAFCGQHNSSSNLSSNCLVTNISVSGAQVRGTAPTQEPYEFIAELVPGTTLKLKAENIWVKDDHFGLKFINLNVRDLHLLRALVWAHRREDLEQEES
jgi:hypothetical protein